MSEKQQPKGWELKELSDVVLLQRGYDLPVSARRKGTIAVLGSNGRVGSHDVCPNGVPVPTLTVGRSGSVGKVCFSDSGAWPLNTTLFAKDYCGNAPKYIYYWLQHVNLGRYAQGVSVPTLNRNSFSSILVDVPPLSDQLSIASVLEQCEKAINIARFTEQKANDLKHATMHKLFTCGLRGEAQKETEIGLVPESWEIEPLGKLCEPDGGAIQTGPFGSQLHSYEYQATGTPVINPTHLFGNKISHEDVPRVSDEVVERLARHKVEVGDILFGRRGEIGRHGLVSNNEAGWLCGTGCFLVRAHNRRINNAYLSYFFSTVPIIEWLNANAAGAIMPNLNNTVLNAVPIAFPLDAVEQQEIIDILDAIDQKIDLHRRKKAVLEELFKSLLHKLMTGEVRVDDLDLSALEEMQTQDQGGAA